MLARFLLAGCLLLSLPACPRTGGTGGGGKAAFAVTGKHLVFTDKAFKDSTCLMDFIKGQDGIQVLEFNQCTFSGKVAFAGGGAEFATMAYGCVFNGCTFEQDLTGDQTLFTGRINMVKCRYKKRVSFQNSTFAAPAGFRNGAFDGDASWNNSLFMREASFMDNHFSDVARFQASRFLAAVQFGNSVFAKNADFTLSRFDDGVWFDYGVFMAKADFGGMRALGPVSFRAAQAGQLLLTNLTAYDKVNLDKLTVKDSTRTQGAVFMRGKP